MDRCRMNEWFGGVVCGSLMDRECMWVVCRACRAVRVPSATFNASPSTIPSYAPKLSHQKPACSQPHLCSKHHTCGTAAQRYRPQSHDQRAHRRQGRAPGNLVPGHATQESSEETPRCNRNLATAREVVTRYTVCWANAIRAHDDHRATVTTVT